MNVVLVTCAAHSGKSKFEINFGGKRGEEDLCCVFQINITDGYVFGLMH